MAKLPDIPYRRNVPVIQSAQAVKSRTKVRNIYAAVGVVDRVVGELDQLVETDARLDAARRGNDAVRDYQTGVSELTQEFHGDTDMSPADYATRLNEVREQSIAGAGEGISTRGRKYFTPKMDNFRTQVNPAEMDLMQKAMTSRQIMQLDDLEKTAVATAGTSPQLVDEEAALYTEQVNGSDLPAAMKRERLEDGLNNMAISSVMGMARDQNLSGMNEMLKSDLYKELSLEQQRGLDRNIRTLSQEVVNEESALMRNQLIAGDIKYATAQGIMTALTKDMPGMSDAQRVDFVNANNSSVAVAYVAGLIRRDQPDTALAFLESDEGKTAIKDPDAYLGALGAATSGVANGKTTALYGLNNRAANEATSLKLGRPADATVLVELKDMLAKGGLSPAQENKLSGDIVALGYLTDAADQVMNAKAVTDNALSNMVLDSRASVETYEGDNLNAYVSAQSFLQAQTSEMLQQRTADPVTYAATNDPTVRDAWRDVKDIAGYALTAGTPEEEALYGQQAAMNYAKYKTEVAQTISGYGHAKVPNTVPVDGGFIAALGAGLNAADRPSQLRAIGAMKAIFGEDAYDIGAQLSKEDPGIGGAVLYDILGLPSERDTMIQGKAKIDRLGSGLKITEGNFLEDQTTVTVPWTALGIYAEEARGMIYTYAMGVASDAEIQAGELKDSTLLTARDAIVGEPFTINEYGQQSIPYRDTNGKWVSSETIKNQFMGLRMNPNSYTGPQPFYSDGTVAGISEALRFATPVLIGDGTYRLDLPASSGYGSAGFLMDADGSPFELEVRGLSSSWRATSRRVRETYGRGGL